MAARMSSCRVRAASTARLTLPGRTLGGNRAGRPGEGDAAITKHISWGPGPRAAQALMLASRARALVDGRLSPSLDDIRALATPVLKHRMALTFAARAEGETVGGVIKRLMDRIG